MSCFLRLSFVIGGKIETSSGIGSGSRRFRHGACYSAEYRTRVKTAIQTDEYSDSADTCLVVGSVRCSNQVQIARGRSGGGRGGGRGGFGPWPLETSG